MENGFNDTEREKEYVAYLGHSVPVPVFFVDIVLIVEILFGALVSNKKKVYICVASYAKVIAMN